MSANFTTAVFVERAKKIQTPLGRNYDYSLSNYINARTKVDIICPNHGIFHQAPRDHLRGQGCPTCAILLKNKNNSKTQEQCIRDFHTIHGDKYDYSKVHYVNARTKVEIICPKHGSFWQTPRDHMRGRGCKECAREKLLKPQEQCIKDFQAIHGDKYNYSKVKYINRRTKVEIVCPEHGSFWQTPSDHLEGYGCPTCGTKAITKTQKQFIEDSHEIHGYYYDYSKVNYVNTITEVEIICPEHGSFWQKPREHMKGCGCPNCKASKLEKTIAQLLEKNECDFAGQQTFEWLINDKTNANLYLDFYLPEYNIAIECQGRQHFEQCPFFHKTNKDFARQIHRDNLKRSLCEEHGIKLLYFASNEDYIDKAKYEVITELDELIEKIRSAA